MSKKTLMAVLSTAFAFIVYLFGKRETISHLKHDESAVYSNEQIENILSIIQPICEETYPTVNLPDLISVGFDETLGFLPVSCINQEHNSREECEAENRQLKTYNPYHEHADTIQKFSDGIKKLDGFGHLTAKESADYELNTALVVYKKGDQKEKIEVIQNQLKFLKDDKDLISLREQSGLSSCDGQAATSLFKLLDKLKKYQNVEIQSLKLHVPLRNHKKFPYGEFANQGKKDRLFFKDHRALVIYPKGPAPLDVHIRDNAKEVSDYFQIIVKRGGFICDPWNNGYFKRMDKEDSTNLYGGKHPWSGLKTTTIYVPSKLLKDIPKKPREILTQAFENLSLNA